MLLSTQSEQIAGGPESTPDAAAVRTQLDRLLAHTLFTHSKRYPVLLAYTVEQTLLGHAGDLKERTIGVEAFGREPNYDVALDPVVRTTAAEVRKRLVQYYYNPEHAGELLIELPVGAYVPSFRAYEPRPAVELAEDMDEAEPQLAAAGPARWTVRWRISVAAAVSAALLAGFGLGRVRLKNVQSETPRTSMERFWAPFTDASSRVTYCIGEPAPGRGHANRTPDTGSLNVSDVTTLARSIVPLVARNGEFRVVPSSTTTFGQLREGPAVLIGVFDNPWTLRLTRDLPIGFEFDGTHRMVVRRDGPQPQRWISQSQSPGGIPARDYAIVARIRDKVTGQPVMILGGILGEGTEAASEVVSNPRYLDAMLRKAPAGWEQRDLEAVIETQLIEGHHGPPAVVAVAVW